MRNIIAPVFVAVVLVILSVGAVQGAGGEAAGPAPATLQVQALSAVLLDGVDGETCEVEPELEEPDYVCTCPPDDPLCCGPNSCNDYCYEQGVECLSNCADGDTACEQACQDEETCCNCDCGALHPGACSFYGCPGF